MTSRARQTLALVLLGGIGIGCAGKVPAATAPPPSTPLLAVGTPAPDVGAPDQDGKDRRLSEFRGKRLVLFFYPRDFTNGCSMEVRAFRTDYEKFKAAGVEIVGVSIDPVDKHKSFCATEGLPFTLLADTKTEIARAFGVPIEENTFDRVSFVLDETGVVRRTYPRVHPVSHAAELLTDLGVH